MFDNWEYMFDSLINSVPKDYANFKNITSIHSYYYLSHMKALFSRCFIYITKSQRINWIFHCKCTPTEHIKLNVKREGTLLSITFSLLQSIIWHMQCKIRTFVWCINETLRMCSNFWSERKIHCYQWLLGNGIFPNRK